MHQSKSNFVPVAFWIAFLALGFVTSLGAPSKAPRASNAIALQNELPESRPQAAAAD